MEKQTTWILIIAGIILVVYLGFNLGLFSVFSYTKNFDSLGYSWTATSTDDFKSITCSAQGRVSSFSNTLDTTNKIALNMLTSTTIGNCNPVPSGDIPITKVESTNLNLTFSNINKITMSITASASGGVSSVSVVSWDLKLKNKNTGAETSIYSISAGESSSASFTDLIIQKSLAGDKWVVTTSKSTTSFTIDNQAYELLIQSRGCNGGSSLEGCSMTYSINSLTVDRTTTLICKTDADNPCDGVLTRLELVTYLNKWINGQITKAKALEAVVAWSS